jgi:hypothetical protein
VAKRTIWGPINGVKGICVVGQGTETEHASRSNQSFYCEEHKPTASVLASHKAASSPAGPSDSGTAPAEDGPGGAYSDSSGERRPSEPKESSQPSLFARLKGSTGAAALPKGAVASAPGGAERRPSVAPKRRVSTADFWGDAVEGASSLVGRAGYVPAARAMVWTSPVAGDIIEDATKGTIADKLVQPLARNAEKWNDLFDLLGFWAAIGAAQANPAQAPAAMNFARKRLVNMLPRIARKIKEQKTKEREAVAALAELMPDLGDLFPGGEIPAGVDPVDALLMSLFAPPEGVQVEEPVGA